MKNFLCLLVLIAFGEGKHPAINDCIQTTPKISGQVSKPHSHPFMVTLQLANNAHICGGSILSKHWILTAGNCFMSYPHLYAIAGTNNIKNHVITEQKRKIYETVIHPKYQETLYEDDIALGKVEKPFQLNDFVQAIALPVLNSVPTGKITMIGWGMITSNEKLREVDLTILPIEKCVERSKIEFNNSTNLCTGVLEGGRGSCNGDSGSPLVQNRPNESIQVGMINWGFISCKTSAESFLFIKVSAYTDFIRSYVY